MARKKKATTGRRPRQGAAGEPPWHKVKSDFVLQPDRSIRELAKKHGVSEKDLWQRARDEDWRAERTRFAELVRSEACERAATQIARLAVERFKLLVGQYQKVSDHAFSRYLETVKKLDELALVEEKTTELEDGETKDGKADPGRRTVTRTKRPRNVNEKLEATAVRLEFEFLAEVLGLRRMGQRQAEEELTIEID